MPKLRNGSKGDSNPGSLDCESSILPLSCGTGLLTQQKSFDSVKEAIMAAPVLAYCDPGKKTNT